MPKATGWHNIESSAGDHSNNTMKIANSPKFIDRTGMIFGKIRVVEFAEWHIKPSGAREAKWKCVCECGIVKNMPATSLRPGVIESCGCLRIEAARAARTTHGATTGGKRIPEYTAWCGMIARTTNQKTRSFPDYGGRGVQVCDRWNNSFDAFLSDMGGKPSPAHSIDRIDNEGNYEPSNCRWADLKTQANNKRNNIILTCNGKTLPISDWVIITGLKYSTIRSRIETYGWSAKKALTTPLTQ
jgi:hypothetical protein